jgi:hypothetical protein
VLKDIFTLFGRVFREELSQEPITDTEFTANSMKSPAPYVVPPSGQWDGGWSTFVIRVGTPGQEFRVLPSTAGSETFIPLVGACLSTDPPNCQALRGVNDVGGFSSTGFHANESSSWKTIGLYDLGLDARLGDIASASGLYGSDTVALGSLQQQMSGPTQPIAIGGQTVAGVVKKTWLLGLLGCNVRPSSFSTYSPLVPSLLQNLRNQSLIPSLSYSYTAGAVYGK